MRDRSKVWPTNQLGVRISPWSVFLDCTDSDDASLYQYVCQELGKRDLAYVSVVEREWLEDEAFFEIQEHLEKRRASRDGEPGDS